MTKLTRTKVRYSSLFGLADFSLRRLGFKYRYFRQPHEVFKPVKLLPLPQNRHQFYRPGADFFHQFFHHAHGHARGNDGIYNDHFFAGNQLRILAVND